jgi:hypothetical protein
LDYDGLGARELGLRREWVGGGGLQLLDREHWMDFHGYGQFKFICLCPNAFEYLEGTEELFAELAAQAVGDEMVGKDVDAVSASEQWMR